MKQLSHLLQRITPNLAVILLGLFFILGSDENYPIITILDDNPAIIKLGDVYADAGATAEDKQDGKVDVITTGLDAIDTSIAKHYTVTYSATDSDKNTTIATRLVKVIEKTVTIEAPKNIKASAGDQQITLTWDDVTAADKYTIYRAEETGITPVNYSVYKGGTILDNKTSPFVLTGLENGKTYYFVVTASKGVLESEASKEVSATPKKVVVQPLGRLNDTGITRCADRFDNDLDCPVIGYLGQDAEFGSNSMSFTKIAEGKCVKDNITGLIWEVKENKNNQYADSLHDADDEYSWYEPNNSINGGDKGYQNVYGGCYGHQNGNSNTYCNTHAYVQRVNTQGWCGYSDWRMPNREELNSISNLGHDSPAIDTTFFPNTKSFVYWSSTPSAKNSNNTWFVTFRDGSTASYTKRSYYHIRLVRKGQ